LIAIHILAKLHSCHYPGFLEHLRKMAKFVN